MTDPASFRQVFHRLRLLWQTRLGGYCLGLDEFAPISVVPTLDDGDDLDAMERETGISFCSLERKRGHREELDDSGTGLLPHAVEEEVTAAIARNPGGPWAAVSPYPSRSLESFAAAAGMPCHCLDWDAFWWFSSKRNLVSGLAELGLPRLPGRWLNLRGTRYSELRSEFGGRLVAQLDLGAAGSGTAIIESEPQHAAAVERFGESQVWVTPYAGALSFNLNAIAMPAGTVAGYPSVQVVGQQALHSVRGGHGGNDFTATASVGQTIVDAIREQTVRIGAWMASRGYRGLFGLDFVVDESTGAPCAVDLNPRWQGSTALEAQAARRQNRIPLAAVEVAFQLGLLNEAEVLRMSDSFFEPLQGAQVFPRSPASRRTRAGRALSTGIYSSDMRYLRPGLRLHELCSPGELLITGGVPRLGRPMHAGSKLLRLSGLGPAIDPHSGRLLPPLADTVSRLYNQLALEPCS
ncbi:MAG: hypothetical protein KIT09_10615 [Bryobacteraceae bacterium]|nr:hypothetical protein [Bryobacteraceae bacterium]